MRERGREREMLLHTASQSACDGNQGRSCANPETPERERKQAFAGPSSSLRFPLKNHLYVCKTAIILAYHCIIISM